MNYRRLLLIFCILLISLPALPVPPNFNLTKLSIVREQLKAQCEDGSFFYDTSVPGMASVVISTGDVRNNPETLIKFVDQMGNALGQREWFNLFNNQVCVTESGTKYWISIQDALFEKDWKVEIKSGDRVKIFFRLAGAAGGAPVLLMVDFQKVR